MRRRPFLTASHDPSLPANRGSITTSLSFLLVFLCLGVKGRSYACVSCLWEFWWEPLLSLIFLLIFFYALDPADPSPNQQGFKYVQYPYFSFREKYSWYKRVVFLQVFLLVIDFPTIAWSMQDLRREAGSWEICRKQEEAGNLPDSGWVLPCVTTLTSFQGCLFYCKMYRVYDLCCRSSFRMQGVTLPDVL
jgi:hypothetical protein